MRGTAPESGIAGFALRHAKSILVLVLGLCVWGVIALYTLPSGIYPDVAFPRIVIIAERGEEAVQNMMIGVTRPIEEAVNAVPGLSRVKSKTLRGASEISLDFVPGTDMKDALSQTRAKVSALVATLPPGIDLTVEQQTPSVFPVISFNVALDPAKAGNKVKDGADLKQWTLTELKPRLARLPNVFLVGVQGSEERVILVEAQPLELAAANLSLDDLVKIVTDSNAVGAVGLMERDYKTFQILVSNELRSLDDIAAIPVVTRAGKTLRLDDVARVRLDSADRTKVVTGNGSDSVVVSLFMRSGGKVTELSDNVTATLEDERKGLPPGVSLVPVYDQANLVRESIHGVRDAIGIGMLLSAAVLWIFLGSWRLTLIAAISMPISVLGTFAVMTAMGESLNLMSLGGIAVAIGLIIDNAIVVVENIARAVRTAVDRKGAVVAATGEVFGAVVGSSLTTVVVFIPLVLLEGVVGQFFKAMAITLAIGILVSMAVSLTLTPIMAAGKLGPSPGEKTTRGWMEAIANLYERVVRIAIRRRWLASLVLLVIAGVGALFSWKQQTGFLPLMDEGGFVLDYRMPVGTSLSETDRFCRRIESILSSMPADVQSYSRRTGAELGMFASEPNTGDFLVGLQPRGKRKRSSEEIISEIRKRIAVEVPQIEAEFVQVMQDTINDLAGNPSPIEVKIFGTDYKATQEVADVVQGKLEKLAGVVDVKSAVSFGSPEITYRLRPDAVSRAGLTPDAVRQQLETALLGSSATIVRRGERLLPVVVRYPDAIRHDPTWLGQIPLADGAGHVIPAASVSTLEEKLNVNELARENQQPMTTVDAGIHGRDLGSIAVDARKMLAELKLPPGVRAELAGQVESQQRAFQNLALVLALATGLVFLLLVAQFRSYRLPAVIFLTLPFSQLGGLLALRITGTELNISAFMGLVMLVGLVVKNGIILVEFTAQLRSEGAATLDEALVQASRIRLRPIVMTSLTAIVALFPLALNLGAGAEMQKPLAIAVIGGLSLSTLFTLIVIPVAHAILGEPAHNKPPAKEVVA